MQFVKINIRFSNQNSEKLWYLYIHHNFVVQNLVTLLKSSIFVGFCFIYVYIDHFRYINWTSDITHVRDNNLN